VRWVARNDSIFKSSLIVKPTIKEAQKVIEVLTFPRPDKVAFYFFTLLGGDKRVCFHISLVATYKVFFPEGSIFG
jgi:hypothetical protein